MDELTLDEALEELGSAEDFLDYFGVTYDASVVHVNRLHILQRFHDYIHSAAAANVGEEERRARLKALLEKAYLDFVQSDALTEKVFKVFQTHGADTVFVPLLSVTRKTAGNSGDLLSPAGHE